jgi:hypothetical protein
LGSMNFAFPPAESPPPPPPTLGQGPAGSIWNLVLGVFYRGGPAPVQSSTLLRVPFQYLQYSTEYHVYVEKPAETLRLASAS